MLHIISLLTQTEIDVLDLLSQGYTRGRICQLRCVELSTVKTQINSILKKFHSTSISSLVEELNGLHIFDYLRHAKQIRM